MSTNDANSTQQQSSAPPKNITAEPKKQQKPIQPPQPPTSSTFASRSIITRFASNSLRLGAKIVGIVTAATLASHLYEVNQVHSFFATDRNNGNSSENDDDSNNSKNKTPPPLRGLPKKMIKKKCVLVLPMQNLKLVEHKSSNNFDDLKRLLGDRNNKQPTITLEAKELVQIIHTAASDPNITALHADFGEGMRYPMGLGHIEEIRNAIRIFNESHRAHRDPNVTHRPVYAMPRNEEKKLSYAFGHSFQWNEYFLASAFTHLHLQARGNLHLFGVTSSNSFFKAALEKYGVNVHIFKHGNYKTAPNMFSETKYSKSHLEDITSITSSLNKTMCQGIEKSRELNFDSIMWKSIFDYGSLSSSNSKEIGLVDSIVPVDPLLSLLHVNKEANTKNPDEINEESSSNKTTTKGKKLEETFGLNKTFNKFVATEQVSLVKYHEMMKKKDKIEQRQKFWTKFAESSTAASIILSSLGLAKPHESPQKLSSLSKTRRLLSSLTKPPEKVAVVTVDGAIGGASSYEIIDALRKIRLDKAVKCVVLRVNSPGGSVISSEAILEELKIVDKPVICSMANAAASGGYYISTCCEKIFANPTTITGSIGVFGIKVDASKWARDYGVTSDYYPHGSHAASLNPLVPLTPGMKDNISRMIAGYYDYFKSIVAVGRSMSVEDVEKVAQGHVWTGEQAKEVGLVDALGGLDRAICYAKSTHTKSGESVSVEFWPKKKDLWDMFSSKEGLVGVITEAVAAALASNSPLVEIDILAQLFKAMSETKFAGMPHFMLTIDEKTALELMMRGDD